MNTHNPLAATGAKEIPHGVTPHTCTCTFAGGEIAIVEVYGADDQHEAHIIAEWLWYPFRYTVSDGDVSKGHVSPFIVVLDHCWQRNEAD